MPQPLPEPEQAVAVAPNLGMLNRGGGLEAADTLA
jgi:hypothetical protein